MGRPAITDRVNDDGRIGLNRDVPRRHLAGWRGYFDLRASLIVRQRSYVTSTGQESSVENTEFGEVAEWLKALPC